MKFFQYLNLINKNNKFPIFDLFLHLFNYLIKNKFIQNIFMINFHCQTLLLKIKYILKSYFKYRYFRYLQQAICPE